MIIMYELLIVNLLKIYDIINIKTYQKDYIMESKIKNIIIIINYVLYACAMIACAILNINASVTIIFLYLLILSSYTVRTYFVYNTFEEKRKINYNEKSWDKLIMILTYTIEAAGAVVLQKYDLYFISFVVFAIIIEDIVVNTRLKISIPVSFGIYIISCIIFYLRFTNDSSHMVMSMLLALPVYSIIFIIFLLINYLFKQNEIINASLKDITIKNIEKDNLYRNLKEAYSKVESITSLRERNKIAAEIHDTVGHTLTTVLVELEASKRLLDKDSGKALEKMSLAQEQVRRGLNDIRSSVRVLEKGEDILDFFNSLEVLIKDTEKHSEVVIRRNIDRNIKIPDNMGKVIFSALIEGLSNGMRHGKSTAFVFNLYSEEDKIKFSLSDNGQGAFVVSPGFGLRAMRNRVEELLGTLDTKAEEGEGFTLNITFPLS